MSSAPKTRERSARDLYVAPVGVTEALLDELERELRWGPSAKLRILDVGAGTGRITAACRAQWPEAHITAAEIDAVHREALLAAGADAAWIADFVEETWRPSLFEFDLIIGNPPYSRGGCGLAITSTATSSSHSAGTCGAPRPSARRAHTLREEAVAKQ